MATVDATTPTLSQLLYTHEKLENLARGSLSRQVIEQIENTAQGVLLEIGEARAQSWDEFERKLAVLLDDYNESNVFLDVIRDDIARLAGVMPELAQAAE
jgi:hypothetical protein